MDIDFSKVEELGGKDLSLNEICLLLEISERKLNVAVNIREDVLKAMRRGKARSVLLVAERLLEQCEKGNISAITWWEKTRRGLAESVRVENEFESAAAAASEKLARAIARLADAEEKKGARGAQPR
jgi:hypothetical protein